MTQPPQDALDLYAFGVGYCEERGIPLSHIRVRWESEPTESHLVKVWHWGAYLEETVPSEWRWGHSDYSFVEGHRKRYPRGLSLSFPSSGDAECYGLSGVTPFEGQETCLVWVNPGHEFLLLRRPEPTMSGESVCPARCRLCDLLTRFSYPHGWSFTKDYQREKKEHFTPPPGIQLPACIKRHVPRLFTTYRHFAICDVCSQTFEPPAPENINSPIKITPSYVKSLGRCPGAP